MLETPSDELFTREQWLRVEKQRDADRVADEREDRRTGEEDVPQESPG